MAREKVIAAAVGAALLLVCIPVAWSALGTGGYYCRGHCICGHDCYVRILGDGYYVYSPGHGVPERRQFTLRRNADGWEVMGLPHSDLYWSPLEGEHKVIGHLCLFNGALYERWGTATNWVRLPRVYNTWRIWAAKPQEHSL